MRPRRRLPLRSLARITPGDLQRLLRAQVALLRAQVRVWIEPRGALVAVGADDFTSSVPSLEPVADRRLVQELALAVGRAAEFGVFRPQCLVRALALQSLLRGVGVDGGRICVGVRRDATGFAAHAWVEIGGQPIGERPEVIRSLAPLADARLVTGT